MMEAFEKELIQKLFDQFEEFRLIMARLEVTVSVAQERFYEKMVEVTEKMGWIGNEVGSLNSANDSIRELQEKLDRKTIEEEVLINNEKKLEEMIVSLNLQVNCLNKELEKKRNPFLINLTLIIVLTAVLLFHILHG